MVATLSWWMLGSPYLPSSKPTWSPRPYLLPLFQALWEVEDSLTIQFLLDWSVIPSVINMSQESDNPVMKDIFYVTRTYVFKPLCDKKKSVGKYLKRDTAQQIIFILCVTELRT